jgi:hypothetical protein
VIVTLLILIKPNFVSFFFEIFFENFIMRFLGGTPNQLIAIDGILAANATGIGYHV